MSNAIANTLELSDLPEYRYQPTRTTRAIYAVGEQYFAQGKTAPKDNVGGPWRKHTDQFWAAQAKTTLWVCDAVTETQES